MKHIKLTQGKTTKVSDEDYEELSQYKWYFKKQVDGNGGYAARNTSYVKGEPRTTIRMHRQLLQPEPHLEVDHINGDKLDNRRENLRLVNRSQNMWNRKKQKGTSKYKGVYWNRRCRKWFAQIQHNGKFHYLGLHDNEEDAALAYQEAAHRLFGDYARY